MDFNGPTDFIVAGMPGQTWAGPPGHFRAGPPGVVRIGEPARVPIHIDPIVRPPEHDTSAPIPQPTPKSPPQDPLRQPDPPARSPVEYPSIGVAVGAANRAESAAAITMRGGDSIFSGGRSAGLSGQSGQAAPSAAGASPAAMEAAALSRGTVGGSPASGTGGSGSAAASAPGASPAAMEAASLSVGRGPGSAPAAPAAPAAAPEKAARTQGTAPVQAAGGAPMVVNAPSYHVGHSTEQSVDVFPSVSVAQGAQMNINSAVSELSNFDHDTANILAPMRVNTRQGDIDVRFAAPVVNKHTGPTSVYVQSGPDNFLVNDTSFSIGFDLNQYHFSFDQMLLSKSTFEDINKPVDFSDQEKKPMDFSESRTIIDPAVFAPVKVELDDLRAELDQELFRPTTVETEDLVARIEFGPYSPAEVDFSDVQRPLLDFSEVEVDRVEEAQPRSSLVQVQINDTGRVDVNFGSGSLPEENTGHVVSFLS